MVTKTQIRKVYEQLDRAAQKHSALETKLIKLERAYYGFSSDDVDELRNDEFISGLHLGEGGDFETFHEMMMEQKTRMVAE